MPTPRDANIFDSQKYNGCPVSPDLVSLSTNFKLFKKPIPGTPKTATPFFTPF